MCIMRHFPITTSFLKREGDIYTSIMQDIMRAYLLFKSAPQRKLCPEHAFLISLFGIEYQTTSHFDANI